MRVERLGTGVPRDRSWVPFARLTAASLRSVRFLPVCGFCLILLAAVFETSAQEHRLPLSADLRPLASTSRSGGPILCELDLDWAGQQIFEPVLEIVVHDGLGTASRIRRNDIVLNTGRRTLAVVLPPLNMNETTAAVEVSVSVLNNLRRVELQRRPLLLTTQQTRNQLVAVCDDWQRGGDEPRALLDALSMEQFLATPGQVPIRTVTARIEPAQMPATAIENCAFDIVVLMPQGLASLESEQLAALVDWVRAGGGLVVQPPSVSVGTRQLEFLNRVVNGSVNGLAFQLDPAGALLTPLDDQQPFEMVRAGLGRVIVLAPELADHGVFRTEHWRRIAAGLWRFRKHQLDSIARQGILDLDATRFAIDETVHQYHRLYQEQMNELPISIASRELRTGGALLRGLIPRDVASVPVSVVAGVLLLYAVVIGPGDFWLLGKLRMRKWTWVVFPAVTLAFALGAIGLSDQYLGRSDHRRSAIVYDMGENGNIVRSSRFELLFSGTQQTAATPVRQAIRVPMDHTLLETGVAWNIEQNARNVPRSAALAVHEGRFPQVYTDRDTLPQWTPRLHRWLSIPAEPTPYEFDWAAVRVEDLADDAGRLKLARQIQQAFGYEVSAEVLHGVNHLPVCGPPTPFENNTEYQPMRDVFGRPIDDGEFLSELSGLHTTRRSYFDLVSQVAPGGAGSFDDLALYDSSDPRQWLLLVSLDFGDDILVYRKLLFESSP